MIHSESESLYSVVNASRVRPGSTEAFDNMFDGSLHEQNGPGSSRGLWLRVPNAQSWESASYWEEFFSRARLFFVFKNTLASQGR